MDGLAEAASAAISGLCSVVLLYPIEIAKNNQQATSKRVTVAEAARTIVRRKGALGLYDGLAASALHSVLEKFGYFYAFALLTRWHAASLPRGAAAGPAASLAIGYLSEFAHLGLTIPVERVFVRIQTGKSRAASDALTSIVAEGGVAGLWAGWRAYLVLALKPAIELAVYEQVKAALLQTRRSRAASVTATASAGAATAAAATTLPAAEAFLLGAVARGVSTLLCYPATRAKILTQSGASRRQARRVHLKLGSPPATPPRPPKPPSPDPGELAAIGEVLRERGPLALYQGIGPEIARGVLSSAIRMAVKERVYASVRLALVGRGGGTACVS